ncbi:G-type lectin S-receptor-like serine/threonine-protein kinase [Sesamum angolense]|uniref:G-type lectin S-receptor-like serine/threonine-protein kinase n=1 Tax=Sesamum angolense TaxID=2727404 RepID=A0AAE2BUU0_9LAMI|nr:G-type lectin S-receptor-like serine/threonine-protein kinase [Sesamum angolense]
MVSSGGMFELGFFSPDNSRNRYVGMWYKNVPVMTVVWVANRETPLTSTSGVLRVTEQESWSISMTPITSYGHPIHQGMKFGWNFITGIVTYLSSWKTIEDPAPGPPGDFTYHLDPTGYPQIVMRQNKAVKFRIGPWDGLRFGGIPNTRGDPTYWITLVMNKNEVNYLEHSVDRSVVTRFTLSQSGVGQRWTWHDVWTDLCQLPKDPEGWVRADWSNGCIRGTNLSCQGDAFLRYSGIKLPDSRHSWSYADMTLEECEAECLRNCSCTAYKHLDLSKGSGCLIWFDDLVDIRALSADGQDIYIRVASSELGEILMSLSFVKYEMVISRESLPEIHIALMLMASFGWKLIRSYSRSMSFTGAAQRQREDAADPEL